jgi:hypothetical protein
VGCSWSPRHPLTERIAMLKSLSPSRRRRTIGQLVLAVLLCGGACFVYAGSAEDAASHAGHAAIYQLGVQVKRGNSTLATPTLCLASGGQGEVRQGDGDDAWRLVFTLNPVDASGVSVRLKGVLGTAPKDAQVNATVEGLLGQQMAIKVGDSNSLDVSLKLTQGCAMSSTASTTANVSLQLTNVGARSAALLVAAKAGMSIVNPRDLDERQITFKFEQMPAASALLAVASIDGKKVEISGKSVRIVSQ